MYSGYGVAFDGAGSWSLGDDCAKNGTVLVLIIVHHLIEIIVKMLSYDINDIFGSVEQMFSINFTKAKAQFSLRLHYNGDNSYFFFNRTEVYNFKANNRTVNF